MGDYRADFSNFEGVAYLNCANHGPFPRVTMQAIQEAIELKARPDRIRDDIYFRLPDEVRSELGGLLGAPAGCFAVTNGASNGVFAVAQGLEWREGDEVLIAEGEFPSNFYTFAKLADRGVTLRSAPAQQLAGRIGRHTRVVAASWVSYNTGERIDLEELGCACRRQGALLLADLSQAAGALDFRLESMPVDVAVGCGYKWLLSPYGTGFAYFRPEWIERLRVSAVYWQAVEGAEDFNRLPRGSWRLAAGARRFDSVESASFLNLAGMRASLCYLRQITPGVIERHARALLDRLRENLTGRFQAPATGSAILCISAGDPAATREAFHRALEAGIVVSLREDRIRVSPNIYNVNQDMDRLAQALG